MQWLQHTNQSNVHNLNNLISEDSRHFRNKKKKYPKAKIYELETNSKTQNIRDLYRGISDFKKGYQPRTDIVKDEMGDVVTVSHSILARWRNHFSRLLNVHGVNNVRQIATHTSMPLAPDPIAFDFEMAIEEIKRNKSPGTDRIPAELIAANSRKIRSEIHKVVNSIWNMKELPEEWKESAIVPVYKKDDKTDCSNYTDISLFQLRTKLYPSSCCQIELNMQRKIFGIINTDFDATVQLLITHSAFVKYLRKNGNKMKQCINYLGTARKLTIYLGARLCLIFSLNLLATRNW